MKTHELICSFFFSHDFILRLLHPAEPSRSFLAQLWRFSALSSERLCCELCCKAADSSVWFVLEAESCGEEGDVPGGGLHADGVGCDELGGGGAEGLLAPPSASQCGGVGCWDPHSRLGRDPQRFARSVFWNHWCFETQPYPQAQFYQNPETKYYFFLFFLIFFRAYYSTRSRTNGAINVRLLASHVFPPPRQFPVLTEPLRYSVPSTSLAYLQLLVVEREGEVQQN